MRTLYLDLSMGAAGDMLAAALLELHPEPEKFLADFRSLGIPGVTVFAGRAEKCGITGTQFRVLAEGVEEDEHFHEHEHGHDHEHHHHESDEHHHEQDRGEHSHHHHHSGMSDIARAVAALPLKESVRTDILAVYNALAGAESKVHGVPVPEIHFHEVGTMDAVADITAVCMLMDALAPEAVIASPVHVGSGTVRCAHGVLPVPAPATAELLKGIPIYGGAVRGELCTPTGAALLKHFVTRFGEMPAMIPEKYGYGMGKKEFEQANCVRATLGEAPNRAGTVLELSCNLDDMTGEALAYASERLFEAGALDVFTLPAGMKKGRPGVLLTALCHPEKKEAVLRAFFAHTSTLGVRESEKRRYTLERREETLETPFGSVRRKTASGWGVTKQKLEYDDLARVAAEQGLSLAEARKQITHVK